ncbi:hypothetical protein FNT36_16225 [Hymenobacter setariae]|uniref:Surface-adhesin protein E-like domain-containing protein n=1 Tax=Hymenobacter setariae TaxID=2594794 RepID=A0A558BRV7_9BACT|nr:surface-adhesin E family protein [Hymenobacter setariae]TVT39205.1 hypothetical protein FNT36_16225 [Hymenobacter setariae]
MKTVLFRFLIIFAIILTKNIPANSQAWALVAKDPNGESYSMKSASNEAYTYNKKVWVRHTSPRLTTHTKDGRDAVFPNASEVKLYSFDCNSRRLMLYQVVVYNSKGLVVNTYKEEEYERTWDEVIPDSIGEMLLNKACQLF